ncbi:putative bifunctional diguanylate cyclase/phosphodiesterase [Devosia rhizoryzae]|uniref:Bifunctional diguanylate cyclase/phosphodiesterase n=1 Tax=Devosia rhizoryzae TaxID=2774137 RepID=A0ABX7C6H7_9HYPH|nr:bifunctional diguanylate cyclase/phosphodiesterase [Devosia rhizoryzae]QQR39347.1 bifunctional diguanylate cyclase/phosphodiesterase [Devosia rhizoryzae]
MRRNQHLENILHGYRNFAIGIALVIAVLAGTRYLSITVDNRFVQDVILPLAWFADVAVLGMLLILGHRWLKRRLTDVHVAAEAARAAAHRDALTGVFSRSYFLEALSAEVHHQSRRSVGYMQLDLDNLKVLNDSAGHGAGDAALQHLVRVIAEVVPGAVIGRLGGDEFGILIRDHDNKQALRRLGEALLRQLDQPVQIAGRPVRVSASIGVAVAPLDAEETTDLISKADLALYKAKRSGRRTVVPFDTDMLADERYRRFVERELRAALLMDELEVHYQPVFCTKTMTVKSHEALLRWRHKVRGMIPPAKFIPFAEESDLIDKLGAWVLRRACLDLPALGSATVSVNVSPVQLRHADFAQRVLAILAETGTDPERLILEVTETVPLDGDATAMANLAELRRLGVRIAIDDFGAGYASLQYLRGFAFDIIKIDRTYVTNAVDNRIDAMIINAIIKIARSLPVEVIAEGVETEAQLQLLTRMGCSGLQGYLLGRPHALQVDAAAQAA